MSTDTYPDEQHEPFVFTREKWKHSHDFLTAELRNHQTVRRAAEALGARPPAFVSRYEDPLYSFIPVWAIPLLRKEESRGFSFVLTQERVRPTVPEGDPERIYAGEIPCPSCDGGGSFHELCYGAATGIRVFIPATCPCRFYKLFYDFWLNPKNVDPLYRDVRNYKLADLNSPFRWRFKRFPTTGQQESFNALMEQANKPEIASMLLSGFSDTGKTTFLMALYARVVKEWALKSLHQPQVPYFWKTTATTLAQEFLAWQFRESRDPNSTEVTPPPTITVEKVNAAVAAGHRPYLFIEEIDKYKLDSEFQNNLFFQAVERIHTCGGAVIATSNLSIDDLRYRLGEQYGPAFLRRLVGPPNGCFINFSSGRVEVNKHLPLETTYVESKRGSGSPTTQSSGSKRNRYPVQEWQPDPPAQSAPTRAPEPQSKPVPEVQVPLAPIKPPSPASSPQPAHNNAAINSSRAVLNQFGKRKPLGINRAERTKPLS